MQLLKTLQKKLSYLKKRQSDKIRQAYLIAAEAHLGQKRSSGEIYISHPIAVANILADMHMDYESIAAAILHDVIEDTTLSRAIVTRKFGKTIAGLVDGVTKLSKIQFSSTAEAQAESFRKMILAMSHDIRVILVKLADRLHNMRTLNSLPSYKRNRIAKETLDIYAPIANRLGIHDMCVELESLSFAALYPTRNLVIQNEVKKARGNRKEIMNMIAKEAKKHFGKSSLPKPTILGREKHIYSIYKKMRRKHLPFSEIMDVYAFRIVVNSIDDCYRALGIAHSLYKPVPGKFKDYIAIPKINGYQSLHTILFGPHGVPIEIQIRTKQMDQVANKGIAAHWLYKAGDRIDKSHLRAQQWINNLLEMQQKTGSSLEFIENVRIDLFPDELYVFTPKGGIMELPRGSTAVDFAYAVHTDIGNSCVSTRIDRQFAPLSTVLMNGQTVAITTASEAKPNPAWLNFVKTIKARSSIRHFLKNQHRTSLIALGEQLLRKALTDRAFSLNKVSKRAIQNVLEETKLVTLEDLYAEIGLGNKVALLAAQQLINATKYKLSTKEGATKQHEKPLLIRGTEGMAVKFAACCNPVPGDAIMGCLSAGRGLVIHTEKCTNSAKLRKKPEQCLLVRWADDIKGEFPVTVQVEMSNKSGSLAALTQIISEAETNIEDLTIIERSGEFYLVAIKLLVRNRDHLIRILHHIEKLPSVTKAVRIE